MLDFFSQLSSPASESILAPLSAQVSISAGCPDTVASPVGFSVLQPPQSVELLEQESGFYFNMKHFEDLMQGGESDELERYLSGFTKLEDNRYSMKIFFEIRKQKYLEALDRHDRAKAVEILMKDLKVFASFNEELFKEITQLLTLENFRQNEQM
ncbi:protein TOPLESS-RELATED PROTEIN 2-like [Miscanthus floridulus]|uniref:protein TOPLESS-RELATED PROTEIN 2-like n=1 Tax=Miscanthus floridulus TaxID=154761 RepID=UPI00345AF352